MPMPMYSSPIGYNQPYGGWQAPQQLYQPQANSFMPKAQNPTENLAGTFPWVFVSSEEDARNRIVQPGQAVSGATQTVTAAAADSVGIAFTAPVRVYRGQVSSRLQVIVTGQAVTTSNVAVEVVKE